MADGAAPQGKAPGAEAGSAAVERRGTTFVVENATQGEAVIEITNRKQRVEISRCSGCAVTVKGKALCLALSHCQRVTVLFDQTQKVDVSHCERVEVQCLQGDTQGLEVHVDSCGDFTLFVPEELTDPAKELQVKTSRSAGVKVTTVLAGDKGRSKLQLVPDALLSKFGPDGVLLTEVCTYS